jgi:hypothetical protein
MGVPMFFEEKTMYTEDAYPSSPFSTSLKEMPSMDNEAADLFAVSHRVLRPWQPPAERDVSWVDDPREYTCNDVRFLVDTAGLVFDPHRMPVNNDDDEDEDEEMNEEVEALIDDPVPSSRTSFLTRLLRLITIFSRRSLFLARPPHGMIGSSRRSRPWFTALITHVGPTTPSSSASLRTRKAGYPLPRQWKLLMKPASRTLFPRPPTVVLRGRTRDPLRRRWSRLPPRAAGRR